jgi:eukaryotic-like serine/threonine-protein kinase
MGMVYRARDTALGRIVALKMLSPELGGEEELHQRFEREAEAVGRVNHPNIVTIYDMGNSEGQLYIAMELLEGDDLRALIERHADVPVADRVRLMIQICEAIGYAHGRGVIHRDIKPANIFVTTGARVKILDFGLARVATRQTITKRGVILGTPDYMSPEQARGLPLDYRSDIYSTGVVLYEVFTGSLPFEGDSPLAVVLKHVNDAPPLPQSKNPRIEPKIATLVMRCLEKDPGARFQSVGELYEALAKVTARQAA